MEKFSGVFLVEIIFKTRYKVSFSKSRLACPPGEFGPPSLSLNFFY